MKKIFARFLSKRIEFFTKKDVKEMLSYLNKEAFFDMDPENLNDNEMEEIIKKIDSRSDEKISWRSFLKFNQDIYKRFI